MSIKVLHISNVTQLSGWSKQAEMHLLALDGAGVDIAARNIKIINNENPDINPRVLELVNKVCRNPDVIILNTLPSMYEKSRIKTVGYFVCETSHFRNTNWANRLNLMDLVLCPCWHNQLAAEDSGVTKPIKVVPECVDTSIYSRTYDKHPIADIHKDKFKFLCVAEWTQRKNIDTIIKAFHLAFHYTEPVELIIKTTPVGMKNPNQDIPARLDEIKSKLKLYNSAGQYKKENILCGFARANELYSLYRACDAFVFASRGEAFGIPVMDALGFGLPVISPKHSGLDYLNDHNAFVVQSKATPCYGANDTLPDLYKSNECWFDIDLLDLVEQMRNCYEKSSVRTRKIQKGRETAKEFSLEKVGTMYKKVLESLL